MMQERGGRRARKKATTRRALADAALRLFLERGFDRVGVKEIAEAADVSVTTLFKYFPGKEALVFDDDADQEATLLATVRDRPPGQSIPAALCALFVTQAAKEGSADMAPFLALIEETPPLREYGRRMWARHEIALAGALAAELDAPPGDVACAALARFALDAPFLARRHVDRSAALRRIFALLEDGWGQRDLHVGKSRSRPAPDERAVETEEVLG